MSSPISVFSKALYSALLLPLSPRPSPADKAGGSISKRNSICYADGRVVLIGVSSSYAEIFDVVIRMSDSSFRVFTFDPPPRVRRRADAEIVVEGEAMVSREGIGATMPLSRIC